MQNKIIKLLLTSVVLFSLQGFSQTTKKSNHPLLDKYYPQKQNTDTNNTVTAPVKLVPETKTAPAVTTTPTVSTATVPAITTTPSQTSTPIVTTVPAVINTPAATKTPAVNKPVTVTVTAPVPVQEKVQTQPPPAPPYMDTRLGSSSKLYDTWEKNNNGAGSVTTTPK